MNTLTSCKLTLWERYQKYLCSVPSLGFTLDISRMTFDDAFFDQMQSQMSAAYDANDALEGGSIANPDEGRMVGHYWLRAPHLAPTPELREEIESTLKAVKAFTADVHAGKIKPPGAARFTHVLSIGIGGSALGPMFVSDALADTDADKMRVHFIDNTDPDGIARTIAPIRDRLRETLCLVISKSGGTAETRNGMLAAQAAYRKAGLDFARHAVAITGDGSKLDQQAQAEDWLARFPMWDWVGGRTSELSAVGLLPAALQGIDIDAMLAGAASCDEVTRSRETLNNPSALISLMWYHATGGKGEKAMVMLPYKDRLLLFARYLQQLIMESLGKRLDLDGNRVDQGVTVYGNKGSTDQHAYVQQLRDGLNNFFVMFIRVLESGGEPLEVEPGVTPGDYLHGFLQGTREALFDNDRQSMALTVQRVDARTVGVLTAIFERAVSFYASLINVNAYHQPGVEAGKKAAAKILAIQAKIASALSSSPVTASRIATAIGAEEEVETVYALLEHMAANAAAKSIGGAGPGGMTFAAVG